jgi:hypothetical protein
MPAIPTSKIKIQRLAIKLSKAGMFPTYSEALAFAKGVYGELREGFKQPAKSRVDQFKNAWQVATDNFVKTEAGTSNQSRGNEQYRVWLETLEKEPKEIRDHPELKNKKGIAKRNTGFKGTAKRVDLGKGTVPSKNIDTFPEQQKKDMRAQRIQREATTTKTAGLSPSQAPRNLVKSPEQPHSTAPSKQGQMLKRAEMTDPAGIAETKYEKELMDVARKEGKKGLQKKLETDTGVKHSKKSMGTIWKQFKKALKFGEGTGSIPIGGPSRGGSNPTKNLTSGKIGINDHIKLL